MSTATSGTQSPTPTLADVPPPSTSSSHTSLKAVATIIPIVVIVAVVVWGMLVAAGVMQHRRGTLYPAPHAPLRSYREKWPEHLEEPKLWDVRTEMTEAKLSLEDLHPLSVELLSDADGHKRSRSWRKKDASSSLDPAKQRRKWRNFTAGPHPGPHSQEGQVTIFVAMPTLGRRRPGQLTHGVVIGTRPVVYTTGEATKAIEQPEPADSEPMEAPVMMELCAQGYIG